MTPNQTGFKARCDLLRQVCQNAEQKTRDLTPDVSDLPDDVQFQEVNAQLMLAVRHLEDARMRLGKAIQYACEDGVSCYDRPPAFVGVPLEFGIPAILDGVDRPFSDCVSDTPKTEVLGG